MAANLYSNVNDFQTSYDLEASCQNSQYTPTTGYFGCTNASRYSLNPSPGRCTHNDLEVCLYVTRKTQGYSSSPSGAMNIK